MATPEKVLKEAISLPPAEQARLVDQLISIIELGLFHFPIIDGEL